MRKQRDDSDARFARIVTTDEGAETHGFFWCGGFSWTAREAARFCDQRLGENFGDRIRALAPRESGKEG